MLLDRLFSLGFSEFVGVVVDVLSVVDFAIFRAMRTG